MEWLNEIYAQISVCSLVNQTLWSQGTYRLEFISARSERICQLPIQFCSEESTDFVDCRGVVKPTSEM